MSCGQTLDRDQARDCRLVIVALEQESPGLRIVTQRSTQPGPGQPVTLHIDYTVEDPAGPRTGFVECTFGSGPDRQDLQAVRTPAGVLPDTRLFVINRYWLGTSEAFASDPLRAGDARHALPLPAGAGYVVQQVVNAIPAAAVYGLLAAAYSLVYGLAGRINLAFGAFAAIGGAAALLVILGGASWPTAALLLAAVLAAASCTAFHGFAISRLVFQPLQGSTGQQGLVATVGLSLFLGEYLRITQGSDPRWTGPILNDPLTIAADPGFTVTVTPIAILVSLVAAASAGGLLWTMRYTLFGREWRAFSDDAKAAALFGIGRDRLFAQTFCIASALAGLAGCITVVLYGDISFAYASTLGLKALAAAILGGIGSIPGAFLGGLFIGLVESGWSAAFPIVNRDLVVFCMLVLALMWRPGGFFGDRDLLPRRV